MPAKRNDAARSIDAHVAARLRELRELRGLSQGDLATQLGFSSRQAVAAYEGGGAISAATLFQLSRLLQVDVAQFYDGLVVGRLAEATPGSVPGSPYAARIMAVLARAPASQHPTILKVVRALTEESAEAAAGEASPDPPG